MRGGGRIALPLTLAVVVRGLESMSEGRAVSRLEERGGGVGGHPARFYLRTTSGRDTDEEKVRCSALSTSPINR
jgi:hypothetical protein